MVLKDQAKNFTNIPIYSIHVFFKKVSIITQELATRVQPKTRWVNTIHYKTPVNNGDNTPFLRFFFFFSFFLFPFLRFLNQAKLSDLSRHYLSHPSHPWAMLGRY